MADTNWEDEFDTEFTDKEDGSLLIMLDKMAKRT